MKTLKNFEAFKFNKAQMNAIAGGAHCHITIINEDGSATYINAPYPSTMSKDQAYQEMHNKYDDMWGAGNVIINC